MSLILRLAALLLLLALPANADLMMTGMGGAAGGGSAPPVTLAWDPAFNADGLSNSNATVTTSGSPTVTDWRSNLTHSSGKIVFRITWTTIGCCGSLGLVPPAFGDVDHPGDQPINYIGYGSDGTIWLNGFNGCTGSAGPAPVAGQPVDMAIDFAANLLWVRVNGGNWNASPTANPSTGAGGFDLTCGVTTTPPVPPYFIGVASSFAPDVWTLAATVPGAGTGTLAGFTTF